jgi:hypothetical protein
MIRLLRYAADAEAVRYACENYWPEVVNNTLCIGLEHVYARGAEGVISIYRLDLDETYGTSLVATL